MTVRELIKELKTMPQDSIVICQKGSEGNGYSPLYAVDDKATYKADSTYSGDVYSTDWSAEDADMDEEEWEAYKAETPPCVVLAPIN
jgi:hypothetical protein